MSAIAVPAASAQSKSARELSKISREASRLGEVTDSNTRPGVKLPRPFRSSLQDGNLFGHLPPVQKELEAVGKLNLVSPSTGDPVLPGQIADVAVHKGYAYLNSWDSTTCADGGTFVVDIRNPASPRQIAFIPAQQPFYHGEGAHVVSIKTPQFTGDVLAVNDETYGSNVTAPCSPADKTGGGFDLYNVTDPANPVPLVQGAGDRSPESSETQAPTGAGNSYHSVFVWQDGPRAYLVASDNVELSDVDIFDITDPTDPEFVKDLDLFELPEVDEIVDESARGNAIFHHDVVVKRIGGQMRMLVSYWDAGYVQLDVDDPANPTYITDTDFDDPDPLTGLDPPEGNAHQAEYSRDNQFFLAADEDFAPFRLTTEITQAPFAGVSFAAALSAAEPIEPGTLIAGDTVFVGFACTGTVPAPPPGVTIAVAERGVCPGGFQEKADAIEAAGYDMGVIFNNNAGAGGGRCESLINMLIDPATVDIPMAFVGRADGLRILGVFNAGTYQCTGAATPTPGDTPAPAVGTGGLTIEFASVFDGWGYAHLYDANTSEEIDAYAIREALDPRYAEDFGDLSIHEFATDPDTNLAYASYYSGGIRVFQFDRANGLRETGAWIDENGSNFWGVEAFTSSRGERLIAGSDRDFGLVILRYTGPGAVKPPGTPVVPPRTPYGNPVFPGCPPPLASKNLIALTNGNDTRNGTNGADLIYAGAGRDIVDALAGDDCVDLGPGRDRGKGGAGDDLVLGGLDDDVIDGSAGKDSLRGGRGNDSVSGSSGNDTLRGESGRDRISGSSGRDRVSGGASNDRITGGSGADVISGDAGSDRINGGSSRDVIRGNGGNDNISARDGARDRITCGSGRDRVVADRIDRVAPSCERVRRTG